MPGSYRSHATASDVVPLEEEVSGGVRRTREGQDEEAREKIGPGGGERGGEEVECEAGAGAEEAPGGGRAEGEDVKGEGSKITGEEAGRAKGPVSVTLVGASSCNTEKTVPCGNPMLSGGGRGVAPSHFPCGIE